MRFAFVVLLATGVLVAAPVPKEFKKADDKILMVGKWEVERANVNGQEVAKYEPEHTVTFTAEGTARFQYPDSGDQNCEWFLDPAATPKRLAWVWTKGAQPNFDRAYLFREGRLIMALSQNGKPLTSLDPGPGVIVLQYKRAEGR